MALRRSEVDEYTATNDRSQAYYDEKFNDLKKDLSQQENNAISNDSIPGYDRKKDGLDDHPISAGNASGKSGDIGENISNVNQAEANPNSINYTGSGTQKVSGVMNSKRKKGPIALLIGLFFGGAVAIGGFFGGPGLLIVNISEVLTNKLNTSLATTSVQSKKIILSKINGTTSGVCSNRVSLFCKYSSLSKEEIKGFNDNGITLKNADGVIDPNNADTPGKTRPTHYTYKGEDIPATEFASRMAHDQSFSADVTKAMQFNAKYASLWGRAWRGVSKFLGISKEDPFHGKDSPDAKAALAVIEEETKNGASKGSTTPAEEGKPNNACKNTSSCTAAEAEAINEANAKVTGLSADGSIPDGTTALDETNKIAKGTLSGLDAAANTIKITGYVDNACSIRSLVNGVGYAAKTVRYMQLARYAMIFLTTASMIKAGTAQPGNVGALGDILTKTTSDNPKSATDSLAYRNVAFGDTGTLDTSASQYMTAAGLTGVLIGVTSTLDHILGGPVGAKSTCGALANPFVQAGSLIAGAALLLIPGAGEVAFGVKEALQIAGGAALVAAQFVLPAMLKDIIAGNVISDKTFGDAAGSALVSGAGATLGTTAQFNGNAPLTPTQAVAYNALQDSTLAEYAQQDRLAYSPLDPTHANTFMGTVETQVSRYSSNLSTISGALTGAASLVSGSFGSIISPYTKAADNVANYTSCQDQGYKDLNGGTGIATDLFCNPIRGIPPVYLQNSPAPADLHAQYVQAGMIDDATGAAKSADYIKFIDTCITRQTSYDNEESDSSECFIPSTPNGGWTAEGQTVANKYIQYVNNGALDQMENGYAGSADASATPASSTSATTGAVSGTAIKGDDYPYKTSTIDVASPLGYLTRECVDFVAWRLNEQSGTTSEPFSDKFKGFGNAVTWKERAIAQGYPVDQKPTLGSVAWYDNGVWAGGVMAGPMGHVAIVSAINADGSITIEQYNVSIPGVSNYHEYSKMNISASDVSHLYYLHMADIKGATTT